MEVASTAVSRAKKLMKLTLLLLRVGFNSSKCKTAAKMSVARIKLLRNKRQAVVKQMRRDIALLLQSGQDATARVRVEHVMREQNILAANELIELFCELLVTRLQMVAKQRECPADLKEGIASLIFAAPRCSEIPELAEIRKIFEKKYGKDFVSAAIELRPNCGVNRMLIDKLSVRTPTGETKLKVLKEIAKEYQIEWDTTETESELLKPPEEKIEGPKNFVSAASFPVKPAGFQPANQIDPSPSSNRRETALYNDTGSAADAAAESARKAIAAAQAAAFLASKDSNQATGSSMPTDFSKFVHNPPTEASEAMYRPQNNEKHASNEERWCSPHVETERVYRRHSHNSVGSTLTEKRSESGESVEKSHFLGWDDFLSPHASDRNVNRRHSYNNAPSTRGGIKFDESDSDEEEADPTGEACPPPERPPPSMPPSHLKRDMTPRVHPKLPDYDDLAARFEALKYQK